MPLSSLPLCTNIKPSLSANVLVNSNNVFRCYIYPSMTLLQIVMKLGGKITPEICRGQFCCVGNESYSKLCHKTTPTQ